MDEMHTDAAKRNPDFFVDTVHLKAKKRIMIESKQGDNGLQNFHVSVAPWTLSNGMSTQTLFTYTLVSPTLVLTHFFYSICMKIHRP